MNRLPRVPYLMVLAAIGLALGAGASYGVLHAAGFTGLRHATPQGAGIAATGASGQPSGQPEMYPAAPSGRVAQAGPSPAPSPTPAPAPTSLFDTEQIVAYYGNPLASGLGVLGEGTTDQMLARLRAQVAAYQAVNPDKKVVPALHLIYEVAQAQTNDDGLYLYRMDDAVVQQYIQLAQQNNMLLFLDLQIGRSSVANELNYVAPYLQLPFVHLALDPEFTMPPGQRPGQDIGVMDAADINAALDRIEQMQEQNQIPINKIVMVHQFQDSMITNKDQLNWNEPRVDLVLDMDGFGDQTGKLSKYDTYVTQQPTVRHAAIKLFYIHDVHLLTEQQVEDLNPRPDVIIYQ